MSARSFGLVVGLLLVSLAGAAGAQPSLVLLKVDLIVVTGPREVEAAHRATTAIPVVTVVAPDLLAAGYVASLARPGGNTIYTQRESVEAGGLMAYGPNFVDLHRRGATFVDKILKRARPDLPIEQPTFDLLLNLRTARALGATFPATLLARANEVVQ